MPTIFRPIRNKLILLVVLSSGLAGVLVAGILVTRQFGLMMELSQDHLRTQANLVVINSTAPLAFGDRKAAQETLDALHALPELAMVRIYDDEDNIFATYQRSDLGDRSLPKVDPGMVGERRINGWLILAGRPIFSVGGTPERLGMLTMVYDIAPILERVWTSTFLSLLFGAGAALIALIAGILVNKVLARPLAELDRTAREISRTRDYAIRAKKYNDDELGRLTDVFNEMLAEVDRVEKERELLLESERVARTEAEHASRMKDEFVATLSHELRSPLMAITGWTHLLRHLVSSGSKEKGEDETKEQFEKGLEVIDRNARAQTQLIEDLLDMSRIVSGKLRLDVQEVQLPNVIEQALTTAQPAARAKEIRLQKIIDPRITPIHGDPGRLQQIVWNLLSNSIKFTPRGGHIQVVLKRINSHVEIVVSDSGQGIAPEFLPHIFERFRQADASTTREHGGLGLGLAIVKHMVELHGGTISGYSKGVGQGAIFTVKLPLAIIHPFPEEEERIHPRSVGTPAISPSFIEQPSLKEIRVLVVDDDADARDMIRRLLETAGATVCCAGSADDALSMLEKFHPTVLVSDIGMPGKDGYQFIREVRKQSADQGSGLIPALALTAFARPEDRTRALLAGYQSHAAKPVNPSELIASIASLSGLNISQ